MILIESQGNAAQFPEWSLLFKPHPLRLTLRHGRCGRQTDTLISPPLPLHTSVAFTTKTPANSTCTQVYAPLSFLKQFTSVLATSPETSLGQHRKPLLGVGASHCCTHTKNLVRESGRGGSVLREGGDSWGLQHFHTHCHFYSLSAQQEVSPQSFRPAPGPGA